MHIFNSEIPLVRVQYGCCGLNTPHILSLWPNMNIQDSLKATKCDVDVPRLLQQYAPLTVTLDKH